MSGADGRPDSPPEREWIERAETELRRAGHRSTGPRSSVIDAVGRQDCVLTADQVAQELKARGRRVGIATVYRTLELLAEMGLLRRLDVGDGLARYEPSLPGGAHHHHHFVCTDRDRVAPFEDAELERAIEALSERFPKPVESHEVILRGPCMGCGEDPPPAPDRG